METKTSNHDQPDAAAEGFKYNHRDLKNGKNQEKWSNYISHNLRGRGSTCVASHTGFQKVFQCDLGWTCVEVLHKMFEKSSQTFW